MNGSCGELADGEHGAVEGDRRDDGVDAGAVREARIDQRARLVDAPADPTDDLVDDAAQVRLVGEPRVDRVDLARPLHEDVVRAVDHDLGDLRVTQQRLERAVAEDLVGDLLRDPGAVGVRERRLLGVDRLLERLPHLGGELGLGKVRVVEARPEAVDERLVHAPLDLAERVGDAPALPLAVLRG